MKSYKIPISDADLSHYYAGVITTGFGSVWTTIFDDWDLDHALVRINR
jgi:hypothetical protein